MNVTVLSDGDYKCFRLTDFNARQFIRMASSRELDLRLAPTTAAVRQSRALMANQFQISRLLLKKRLRSFHRMLSDD